MSINKKQVQKHNRPVLFILLLAVLVAAAGLIFYQIEKRTPSKERVSAETYFGITSDSDVGITAGTSVSETVGQIIDGAYYLDYDSVHNKINPSFYYEEASKVLIVTTPDKQMVLDLNNGGVSENAEAVILNGVLYISLDYVSQWSDIEAKTYENPNRVQITDSFQYAAAKVSEDTVLRDDASIKGSIVEDLTGGTEVRLIDVSSDGTALDSKADGWTKVLTPDGYVGYVEDKMLGEASEKTVSHTSPIGEYTSSSDLETVNLAFHQTTSQAANNSLSSVISNVTGVNVIAPTWFFLKNNQGEITSLTSASYVKTAHDAGMKVWAVLNDFDGGVASSDATASALSDYKYRKAMIDTVMNGLISSGADGLNIDFEHVTQDSAPAFLELVREFSAALRSEGLVLSVDNYVPTYTSFMGRAEQARVADYVVTMCYDEHASGSEEAGSVASLPFVKKGLQDTLKEVPAEKMIAAIPFFTRLWESTGSGTPKSTAYGMTDAATAAESLGMQLTWDDSVSQNYGETESNGTTYQLWMEDEASIEAKMKVINELGIHGVAEWKLGLENSDVWEIIAKYLS